MIRRLLLAAAFVALALLVLAGLARSRAGERVATYEVRPARFVREVAATGALKAVRATPILVPPESGRAQKVAWVVRDGQALEAGGAIVEFDPYEAEREAKDGGADLVAAHARIDKASAEGTKNERSLALDRDLAQSELGRAERYRLTDESFYSRREVVESRLDRELSAARLDVAGRKLDASGKLRSAERALGEIDAAKARLKLLIAEKGLRALKVTAPHPGLVVLERNWRGETTFVGGTVWPGQKVAELPDLSQLEARVFVLEADGAGLAPGLSARVAIEGRPGEEHAAQVTRVEPLAKPRDQGSPVRYFETTLSLSKTEPAFMKPGQHVRAVVRIEEQDAALAIPRGALFEKEGRRVVFRRDAAGFSPVEVALGMQSVSRVVIVKGLAAGDVVALRDPTVRRRPTAGASPPASGR